MLFSSSNYSPAMPPSACRTEECAMGTNQPPQAGQGTQLKHVAFSL